MHISFLSLLSLIASAAAYQVTFPSATDKWYAGSATNKVTWERVSTDAETFTLMLSNEDRSVLSDNVNLIASVTGSSGAIDVPAPSGGFPVGKGFRLNLLNITTSSTGENISIYAQSPEFEIVSGTSSTTGSAIASPTGSRDVTSTVYITKSAGSAAATATGVNKTGSGTNGAMFVVAHVSSTLAACGLLAALLA